MEYQDHLHFAGDWPEGERAIIERAVLKYESTIQQNATPANGEVSVRWVCLRVRINGALYYHGCRFGEGDVLTAASASALAHRIEASAGGQAASQPDEPARGGIPAYRLKKIIDFVRSEYRHVITVPQMAAYIGMSEAHFARAFKQSLGLTPMQYLTQYRIEEAKRLLRTTEIKVEEVAHRVGYTSASHFAEVFRRHAGIRPREFRNRAGH